MQESPQKQRMGIYLTHETLEKVEKLYKEDSCISRSDFIEKAIIFYCGYITAENYQEYFPKVVLSTFQGTLDSFEKRMARLLFKIAVEISVNNRITAATVDVTELNLQRLRARCVDDVKRINGSVSFPQAVDEELEYPLWDD